MCKPVSMRDVIKCLNHLGHHGINEINLLPKSQDALVKPILHELGINVALPIRVQAYKHRTLDNDIVIGYRYEGTIRSDREWVNSVGCDLMERISITSFTDLSLTKELCDLVGKAPDLTEVDGTYYMEDDTVSKELIVETYEADRATLKLLNDICVSIRGDE